MVSNLVIRVCSNLVNQCVCVCECACVHVHTHMLIYVCVCELIHDLLVML